MTSEPARSELARLGRDQSGSAAILTAMAAPALIGMAAMAVDLGALFLAERELQGLADAAAASVVSGDLALLEQDRARDVIDRAGVGGVEIEALTPGLYSRDPGLHHRDRFAPHASQTNAARIELARDVPLHFGQFLLGEDGTIVRAQATATRTDLVAFDLGTNVLSLTGGIGNQLLSQLAGAELALSDDEIALLAASQVELLDLAEALRAELGDPSLSYGEAFASEIELHRLVEAMAEASDDPAVRALLLELAGRLDERTLVLADLIDLGPLAHAGIDDGRTEVGLDLATLLRAVLEGSNAGGYDIGLDIALAGSVTAEVRVVGGQGIERSPWLTITSAHDYVLRTAQARAIVELEIAPGGISALPLRVPLYVELAPAEARLSALDCAQDRAADSVTIEVTPSLGTLAIADVDATHFDDLTREVPLEDAVLADLALAQVTGFAEVALGGDATQELAFSRAEIEQRVRKQAATSDLVQSTAASLLGELEIGVEVAGLGLGLGGGSSGLSATVASTLGQVAPQIDTLLNALTGSLGVGLGTAEVGVSHLRCGIPTLVG